MYENVGYSSTILDLGTACEFSALRVARPQNKKESLASAWNRTPIHVTPSAWPSHYTDSDTAPPELVFGLGEQVMRMQLAQDGAKL
jgi:hypothetical protein